MDEKTFLFENDVKVTNARFIVGGHTYAMSGITSVKAYTQKPSPMVPLAMILLGLIALLVMSQQVTIWTLIVPGTLVLAGIITWANLKATHQIILTTASGEAKALISQDEKWVERVIAALNDAIVQRG